MHIHLYTYTYTYIYILQDDVIRKSVPDSRLPLRMRQRVVAGSPKKGAAVYLSIHLPIHPSMVVSRCRGIVPLSGTVLGTLFLLAADFRRHPTAPFPCRVSISQSTGNLGTPLAALLSNIYQTNLAAVCHGKPSA